MHQHVANATFQVIAGNSKGSGFSFIRKDLVITNYHVIESCFNAETNSQISHIILRTEANEFVAAKILHADSTNDFVVMKVISPLPEGRVVLQPSVGFTPTRGKRLIFAGYPHGEPLLLANEAIISAPMEQGGFAIDGMVNGGNSGGPIIDKASGELVGIITARRYMLEEKADAFGEEITQLRQYLASVSQNSRVEIMGVNFGEMADMFGRSLEIVTEMMSENANPGIGFGYSMQPIIDAIAMISAE